MSSLRSLIVQFTPSGLLVNIVQNYDNIAGQDPNGKKHYKLRSNHMMALTKYVQQGGVIETDDNIPDSLREQLYAEENQRLERRKKSLDNVLRFIFMSSQPSHPKGQ